MQASMDAVETDKRGSVEQAQSELAAATARIGSLELISLRKRRLLVLAASMSRSTLYQTQARKRRCRHRLLGHCPSPQFNALRPAARGGSVRAQWRGSLAPEFAAACFREALHWRPSLAASGRSLQQALPPHCHGIPPGLPITCHRTAPREQIDRAFACGFGLAEHPSNTMETPPIRAERFALNIQRLPALPISLPR